jgi:hypothetical protein
VSIQLVVEVLDHYHGPRPRKLWLIAFAESANDSTRAGWLPRYRLAHRVDVSESRASKIAAELVAEGIIKRDGGGYHGSPARYVLLPLAGTPKGDTKAHSSTGRRVTSERTLKGAPAGQKGDIRGDTHPSYPSVDPSKGTATAQTILAAFIDWDTANGGKLTGRTKGQLAKQIDTLLGEGIEDRHIRQGLAAWRAKEQHPSVLHSFVDAAMNGHARRPRRPSTTDTRVQDALNLAAAYEAEEQHRELPP